MEKLLGHKHVNAEAFNKLWKQIYRFEEELTIEARGRNGVLFHLQD